MSRKFSIIAVFVGVFNLFAATSVYAQANQCICAPGATRLSANDIQTLLANNTVCAVIGNSANTTWQEYHQGSNVVELGNSTTGDIVGTWSVAGGNSAPNSTITYNYGSGGSYTYSMCSQAGLYHFCGATNVTNATINPGKNKCYP